MVDYEKIAATEVDGLVRKPFTMIELANLVEDAKVPRLFASRRINGS